MKKIVACGLMALSASWGLADENPFLEAVANAKLKGTVGTYMEYVDSTVPAADKGWGTGYLHFKLESARSLRTKLGASVFGHTPLWEHSAPGKDAYRVDIEDRLAFPELYLDVGLTDENKTTLRVGRWANKGTHIDDGYSEGVYLDAKQWESVSFRVGAFRRFAELDYDDGENFGRTTGSQDLSNDAVFGSGASSYAFFVEGHADWKNMAFNPYLYVHDGYASVGGLDTKTQWELADDVTLGLRADGYYIDADDSTGLRDAQAGTLAPSLCSGPFTLTVGTVKISGSKEDPALTRPLWFSDYLQPGDQVLPISDPGASQSLTSVYAKLRYEWGGFWTHVFVADYGYDLSQYGTANREYEAQVGYQFENGLDLNLRLFDVEFEGAGSAANDYQKVELHARYRF